MIYLLVWQSLKRSDYEQEKPSTNGLQGKPLLPTSKLSTQDVFFLSFSLTKGRRASPKSCSSDCWAAASTGSQRDWAALPQRCSQTCIAPCELRVALQISAPSCPNASNTPPSGLQDQPAHAWRQWGATRWASDYTQADLARWKSLARRRRWSRWPPK